MSEEVAYTPGSHPMRRCADCPEHSGVMTSLQVHGEILRRFDNRLYQILTGVILTGLAGFISAGVSIHLANQARFDKRIEQYSPPGQYQKYKRQAPNFGVDNTPVLKWRFENDFTNGEGSQERFAGTRTLHGSEEKQKASWNGFYIRTVSVDSGAVRYAYREACPPIE